MGEDEGAGPGGEDEDEGGSRACGVRRATAGEGGAAVPCLLVGQPARAVAVDPPNHARAPLLNLAETAAAMHANTTAHPLPRPSRSFSTASPAGMARQTPR